MARACPGGARLSALGFCITLFAFSVFWQRRLARVMGHGIPYQTHRCVFHLFFICRGLLSEFCGCWLIFGHWLGHQRTPIISFQMPGSLTSLTTEAQTSRIPVWKTWKQKSPFIRIWVRNNSDHLVQSLSSENQFHLLLPLKLTTSWEVTLSYMSLLFMKRC